MNESPFQVDEKLFETLGECPYCESSNWCVFCKAPDRLAGHVGTFYLARCEDCGLVFQNPRIKQEYIGNYYTQELGYYHPVETNRSTLIGKLKQFLLKKTLACHFNYHHLDSTNSLWWLVTRPLKRKLRVELMPSFVKNGRVLEIGCSHGARLAQLKKLGWEVCGVEMDESAANYARNQRGLNVKTERIEKVDFRENQFDVIIMSMVLEHLYDPFEVLERLTKWLKHDGQLFFSIPYFRGLEFQIFGEYAYGLQLPTHITFFTREILKEHLTSMGYNSPKFYFQSVDRDFVASAQYRCQEQVGVFDCLVANNKYVRLFLIRPIVFVLSFLEKSSRVSVMAEKIH